MPAASFPSMTDGPNPDAPAYRRLPGSGTNGFLHTRLYRGPDHLLQVASSGFTETYKRFYFQDIQSITLHETMAGKLWNGVCGGLAVTFLLTAFGADGVGQPVLASIATFWLVLLAINIILGPTCACYLTTAVQRQKLGSLGRIRRARRVIEELRPHFLRAQEEMSPEEISRRLDQA